jgi:serine/threonine protein phosphatase PrpC
MVVTCQACGAFSHDLEFCDHCNADLTSATPPPAPRVCRLRPDQYLYLTADQVKTLSRPEAAVTIQTTDEFWRVHWIPRSQWPAWQSRVEARLRVRTPVLPPCRLIEDSDGMWVVAQAEPTRVQPWTELANGDPHEQVDRLLVFLELLSSALEELDANGLIWLTFDPRELEVTDSRLRITNSDLVVYPTGSCPDLLPARPTFTAPEICRFRAADFNARTDVFHLAIFAYYWLARLLPNGFLGQGLEAFGYAIPKLRVFAPLLPPGINAVLSRGLAVGPVERQAGPDVLIAELREALDRARQRHASTRPIRWQTGAHTRTGRSKFALDRANEDQVLVLDYTRPDRLLAVVADGISTCSIGNGALASQRTCAHIEEHFHDCRRETFAESVRAVCHQAAQGLLDWAVENGYGEDLSAGSDLMGTTLTAVCLEDNQLALANLGDSRAYLITPEFVEQLTVDGDMGSTLLTVGMPPEDVQAFGGMSRSLRECVGGSVRSEDDQLLVNDLYCTPAVSTWTLVPGDVLVLCSDGLVDEGVFLEPEAMAELVRRFADLPAEALAIKLADAADALQRMPSALEPDGFGDNISCIVIKILG